MDIHCLLHTTAYLSSNHDCPGNKWSLWVLLESVVEDYDVQTVHQLPLVLVDPLHLHVKHGGWIHLDVVVGLKELSKLHLVFLENSMTILNQQTKVHIIQSYLLLLLQLLRLLGMNKKITLHVLAINTREAQYNRCYRSRIF